MQNDNNFRNMTQIKATKHKINLVEGYLDYY